MMMMMLMMMMMMMMATVVVLCVVRTTEGLQPGFSLAPAYVEFKNVARPPAERSLRLLSHEPACLCVQARTTLCISLAKPCLAACAGQVPASLLVLRQFNGLPSV